MGIDNKLDQYCLCKNLESLIKDNYTLKLLSEADITTVIQTQNILVNFIRAEDKQEDKKAYDECKQLVSCLDEINNLANKYEELLSRILILLDNRLDSESEENINE